ncbi:MAG: helix-turn-helix transcriptional regulator [Bacilli bacterium]|nr:helix-turn-helix transcriptional regulator [Bacilli bacterium]
MKEFGEILRELRIKENLSQEALGNIVHVSRSAIAKYENGLGLPSKEVIDALCKYFKVDKDYLFPKEEIEKVIVSKNIRLKKFKYFIYGLIAICLILLFILVVSLSVRTIEKEREKEQLLNEITSENELVPTLNMDFKSLDFQQEVKYNSSLYNIHLYKGTYYIYNTLPFEIVFEVDYELYRCLGEEGKVKFNVGNQYVDVKKHTATTSDGKRYQVYYRGKFRFLENYDKYCNFRLDEFIYTYHLRNIDNGEIQTLEQEKNAIVEADSSIPVCFKHDSYISVTIKYYNKEIGKFTIHRGESPDSLLNTAYDAIFSKLYLENLVTDYKEELALNYSLYFENKIEWSVEDGMSMFSGRYEDFTLVAKSKLISNNVKIELPKDTIESAYPDGRYGGNNQNCDKLTIYEGSRIEAILVNGSTYFLSGDEIKMSSSNNNVEIKDNRVYGVNSGYSTITLDIDLGFISESFVKEIEILPYAKAFIYHVGSVFIPYNDITIDFYTEEAKKTLLEEANKVFPERFKKETGYDATVVDLYRFGKSDFFVVLDTTFEYKGLQILINEQNYNDEVILNLGDRLDIEFTISDEYKYNGADYRYHYISGDNVLGGTWKACSKGKGKYAIEINIGTNPYPIIIEIDIVVN